MINDNSGKSFQFKQALPNDYWGGYVAIAADGTSGVHADQSEPSIAAALGNNSADGLPVLRTAVSSNQVSGLRLDLSTGGAQQHGAYDSIQGRRAAWYSLSFLMRTVAAKKLDIQSQEFNAGIYTG